MNTDAGSVNQLSASVESLTAALISSEHRHRSLERMFRWGGIAFVGFAAVVFYIGFDLVGKAHAAAGLDTNNPSVARSLANIDTSLARMVDGMGKAAEQGEQMMQQLGPTIQDVTILISRIKADSDWLRQSGEKHLDIANELHNVSLALQAVPVMATEMQRMSASIQSMTYSVGSTMGRAGSWMPW